MWEVIVTKLLIGVGVSILGFATKLFSDWVKVQKESREDNNARMANYDAWEALSKGVALTTDNYVKDIKRSSQDNKLTKAEIENANKKAIETAISLATAPAVKIITTTAIDVLKNMIESLLVSKKNK